MASVVSLGIHKPTALPFLIAEGILPPDASENLLRWQSVNENSVEEYAEEEELAITDYCVVWTRGCVIQRVFRFEVEKESVTQATFAHFPSEATVGSAHPAKEDVPPQYKMSGVMAEAGIRISKVRASGLNPQVNDLKHSSEQREGETPHLLSGRYGNTGQSSRCRALVVILRTKAHVIFLSGASHTVHLPFEVDRVFPLFEGILLQRSICKDGREPPIAHPNSLLPKIFAFNQRSASGRVLAFQEQNTQADLPSVKGSDLQSLPTPSDLLRQSGNITGAGLPRLFSLSDPLTEMGIVVAGLVPIAAVKNSDHQKSADSISDILDPNEDLLYVSSGDEFEKRYPRVNSKPNLLAVTQNHKLGLITIWSVTSTDADMFADSQRNSASLRSGTASRRRSSYGPGVGTGATTPVARGALGARESTGTVGPRGQLFKETTLDSGFASTQEESQLEPAFENPSVPAKSSRRVSSLLARADLSNARDKSTFSDLASGYAGFNANRRGASFGAYGTRASSGLECGAAQPHSKSFNGQIPSLDSSSFSDPLFDEDVDGSDILTDHISLDKLDLGHAVRGLRKEMVFTKFYSIPIEKSSSQSLTKPAGLKIFTLRPPDHNLGDRREAAVCVMCLSERDTRKLSVLEISLQRQASPENTHDRRRMASDGSRRGVKMCPIRVTKITKHTDIIDACKIMNRDYTRILLISQGASGSNDLSLQAPWSTRFKLQLPSTFFVNDPYNLNNSQSTFHRSEGGFKRILSENPQYFIALQHTDSNGRVDIIDSEGRRHRIEIQLRPNNPYVRKMIRVCESVLPQIEGDKESVLRGWWDVMSWLHSRPDESRDIEWTAMIVVLFCMAVDLTGDRPVATAARQMKRKTGLLRSSSGANTDLGSWVTMSNEESQFSTSPHWVQDVAWSWTVDRSNIKMKSVQSSFSKFSKPKPAAKPSPNLGPGQKKTSHLLECVSLTREFSKTPIGVKANGQSGYLPTALSRDIEFRRNALPTILVGLHLLREEYKLDVLAANALHDLTPILAQIGCWLGWESWGFKNTSFYMLESVDVECWLFDDSLIRTLKVPAEPFPPPSIFHFIESAHLAANNTPFMSLFVLSRRKNGGIPRNVTEAMSPLSMELTPRTVALTNLFYSYAQGSVEARVADMASWGIDASILETLPESVAVAFRATIASCQIQPVTTWDSHILELIGRDDIGKLELSIQTAGFFDDSVVPSPSDEITQDVHIICNSSFETDSFGTYDESAEEDRQAITSLIFKDDQRFAEAAKLLHPLDAPIARCVPEPDWSDTDFLEAQQELVKTIVLRTLSTPLGRGLMFYCARLPLLTERFWIHGFTLSCVMRPSNTTVTADRNAYSEEKVSWAYFHAGVEAGLSISRNAKGIDTSWITFNKPHDPKNRHAGFLFALGLNGHLKWIAIWVAYRYFTPKHTMTSIGLLLGLSVSYLGTMDTLITRLLTIHVTRLLPPGSAELNVSPLTQTSGIMGVGLLYSNTQHRRMSEIMLSEIENIDDGDNSSPLDILRDEGYRLAAGFALGYINLGRGKDLKGLHDMHIVQRLLYLAVGTRKVNIVHILDKATAGATVAIALIFMKTHDVALARKIDIPDTTQQFVYVRPDIFLLRTVARHLIMWNDIRATCAWMGKQLPAVFRTKLKLTSVRTLNTDDMPFFNIIAGLCLSIGLRFAGTGSFDARNLLCHYLDQFIRVCALPTRNYDGKLTRITARNCQNVVALAAACVMAGTGDLLIFRRLRSLHGRTDVDTPYGSHLAAHMALGILFLGGGTHTFGTSNIAIASLLCAFYPLFPNAVLDNKSHLQAFRHFWVLAAEPRCLIARDADSHRPVSLAILLTLRSGEEVAMTAPCMLPELDIISKIQTNDSEYWRVTLDFSDNPMHFRAFKHHQSIYVRRRAAYDAHASVFGATMQALNDSQSLHQTNEHAFRWIFMLPALAGYDRAEQALVLPGNATSTMYRALRGTIVDDRLVFEIGCMASGRSERLWNLRILFAWADGLSRRGEKWGWFGKEIVESLRAALRMKTKAEVGEQMRNIKGKAS